MAENNAVHSVQLPGYPEKQCSHGRCLDHSPKWAYVEETIDPQIVVRSEPGLIMWLIETFLLNPLYSMIRLICRVPEAPQSIQKIELEVYSHYEETCCGKPMIHCEQNTHCHCSKCGRKDIQASRSYRFCTCCGYKKVLCMAEVMSMYSQRRSNERNAYFGLGGLLVTEDELADIRAKLEKLNKIS